MAGRYSEIKNCIMILRAIIDYFPVTKKNYDQLLKARPSLIPSLCPRFTRAGIEWRRLTNMPV